MSSHAVQSLFKGLTARVTMDLNKPSRLYVLAAALGIWHLILEAVDNHSIPPRCRQQIVSSCFFEQFPVGLQGKCDHALLKLCLIVLDSRDGTGPHDLWIQRLRTNYQRQTKKDQKRIKLSEKSEKPGKEAYSAHTMAVSGSTKSADSLRR